MLPFLEWIVFLCVLQTTQSFSLIDRICKINSSFDRCASRAKQGDTNNGTHSKWIRADELSEEDQKFLRLARQTGDDPYVCPKPFRFKTYAEQAVEFCIRYKDQKRRGKWRSFT
ncbi:hypothetical protein COOONC_01558 [Cooperia oncophora]